MSSLPLSRPARVAAARDALVALDANVLAALRVVLDRATDSCDDETSDAVRVAIGLAPRDHDAEWSEDEAEARVWDALWSLVR